MVGDLGTSFTKGEEKASGLKHHLLCFRRSLGRMQITGAQVVIMLGYSCIFISVLVDYETTTQPWRLLVREHADDALGAQVCRAIAGEEGGRVGGGAEGLVEEV